MTKDFSDGLAEEPIPFALGLATEPIPDDVGRAVGDPPWPADTTVTADSIDNYINMVVYHNPPDGWGLTGLMAVVADPQNACYGRIEAGTCFLFPGIYSDNPPPYDPQPSLNCAGHQPLHSGPGLGTLHQQMCDLLGLPATSFVGFGVIPPLSEATFRRDSATCNPYWFNGSRSLPQDWIDLIYATLDANLNPPKA